MKLALSDLARSGGPFDVVVHSLDQAPYQATVCLHGREHLLLGADLRPLRTHSLQAMREALAALPVRHLSLSQRSAYDEMIGQPAREGANTLAVPLAPLRLAADGTDPCP